MKRSSWKKILPTFTKISTAAWLQNLYKLPINSSFCFPLVQSGELRTALGMWGPVSWVPPLPSWGEPRCSLFPCKGCRWGSLEGTSSLGKSMQSSCRKHLQKENLGGHNPEGILEDFQKEQKALEQRQLQLSHQSYGPEALHVGLYTQSSETLFNWENTQEQSLISFYIPPPSPPASNSGKNNLISLQHSITPKWLFPCIFLCILSHKTEILWCLITAWSTTAG